MESIKLPKLPEFPSFLASWLEDKRKLGLSNVELLELLNSLRHTKAKEEDVEVKDYIHNNPNKHEELLIAILQDYTISEE